MTHEFAGGDPAFLDFPTAEAATGARSATIATFPAPMGAGRTRGSRTALRTSSEPWIGESPEMLEVVERIRRIAPSLAAVMLVGESGTGKEGAARLLHTGSARSSGPFVSVNCGAIPANLVEAELFGYERGAFTGAVRQHQGYFERASGGTLFLDEITEMPLDLQAKLLRVLESGRLVRVGGTEEIAIDVRIVTATNRPTDEALRDRRLREDLFYRLAVFVVRLPALRERGDDLALLADAFLAQLNQAFGTAKRFDPTALAGARALRVAGKCPRAQELRGTQLRSVGRHRPAGRATRSRRGGPRGFRRMRTPADRHDNGRCRARAPPRDVAALSRKQATRRRRARGQPQDRVQQARRIRERRPLVADGWRALSNPDEGPIGTTIGTVPSP